MDAHIHSHAHTQSVLFSKVPFKQLLYNKGATKVCCTIITSQEPIPTAPPQAQIITTFCANLQN